MNEELQATLEWLKDCGEHDYIFETGNSKMLLDYITNLQQENEELKKNQRYNKKGVFCLEYDKETLRDMVDELQERIEKAVEYIENNSLYDEILDYDYEENPYISYTTDEYVKDNLLDILSGDNNE